MKRTTILFLLCFLVCTFHIACSKSEESADETGRSSSTSLPRGWEPYHDAEHGFTVTGPGTPQVKHANIPYPSADGISYQFLFARNAGMGQVMVLAIAGDAPYDVEEGIDGACNGIVENLSGTMLEYEKRTIDGKMARAFRFSASTQGQAIMCRGLAVATGPRTIKVAMSCYLSTKAGAEKLADIFVDSFEVE